jgi:hypothetical protein
MTMTDARNDISRTPSNEPPEASARVPLLETPSDSTIHLYTDQAIAHAESSQDVNPLRFMEATPIYNALVRHYDQQRRVERDQEPGIHPTVARILVASDYIHKVREIVVKQKRPSGSSLIGFVKSALGSKQTEGDKRHALLVAEGMVGATIWPMTPGEVRDFHHEIAEGKHEWIFTRWDASDMSQHLSLLRYVIEPHPQGGIAVRKIKALANQPSESHILDPDVALDMRDLNILAAAAERYLEKVANDLYLKN